MAGFAVLFALVRMGQPAPAQALRPGLPLRIVHSSAAEFAWCFLRAAVWGKHPALRANPDLAGLLGNVKRPAHPARSSPATGPYAARLVRVAILIATSVLYIYAQFLALLDPACAVGSHVRRGAPDARRKPRAAQVRDRV
ncbi:MAG: hypothetical protein R3A10_18740 [Caldilineaceae bacterium]